VVKYSLEIKQSAQKELDALDDAVFARIDRKILVVGYLLEADERGLKRAA